MPKVSEAAQETQRTRPPRVAAPAVSFCNKNEEEEEILGVVLDEIRVQEEDEDDFAGIGRLLKDLYKRQAKKTTLANAAYENQKKAIYTAGRHLAQEIVRDAVRQLDNVEESLLEMKKREWSYERYVADIIPLWNEQDALINQLLDTYDHPLDDVFPNRAETIASAEQTLKENPARRKKALEQFLGKAREQLEESCRNKEAATDASKLIKHYKALLLA